MSLCLIHVFITSDVSVGRGKPIRSRMHAVSARMSAIEFISGRITNHAALQGEGLQAWCSTCGVAEMFASFSKWETKRRESLHPPYCRYFTNGVAVGSSLCLVFLQAPHHPRICKSHLSIVWSYLRDQMASRWTGSPLGVWNLTEELVACICR